MNRNFFRTCTLIGALGVLAACGETPTGAPTPLSPSAKPALGVALNLNGADGACLATDAFLSGAVSGVNDDQDLADPAQHCTANDVSIASATINSFSFDGVNFTPFTGQNIECDETQPIFLDLNALLQETATSTRTDIGVWIATDGGNARTGTCNQYNLRNAQSGVSNTDSDSCGDLVNAGSATVPLGVISTICQTATNTSTLLHIGSCVGWTEPGGDQVCPQGNVANDNNFRWGTVPGTTSKCNCGGFDVPITVRKTAKLEVAKVCTPTNDNGTFDLLIDGSTTVDAVVVGDNKACGTSTGAQTLSAGTNTNPGAVHSFGEGDFTTANYTSSYSCVNRLGTGPQHVFTASGDAAATGTSLGPNQITLQPGEDVICTYTNVRKATIVINKVTAPASDPQDFAFTTTGSGLSSFTLDTDAGDGTYSNTQTFSNIAPGSYTVTETGVSGWDLTNLVCTDPTSNSSVNIGTGVATINVAAGETVSCTYTNTKEGSITITKVTVPSSHPQDFAFTTTGSGLSSFTLDTDAGDVTYSNTKTFTGLSPNTYTVTEGAVSGWDLTDVTCTTGGSDVGAVATIVLPAGGSVTCTYTNTQRASLTLNKVENGGLPLSRAWTFELWTGRSTTQNGTFVASASANVTTGVVTFSGTFTPGAYQLCETGMPVGYTNNITGFTPLGATPEGGDNSTECINITLVSGANGPGGITGVPNPIDNVLPPPPGGDARTIGYWKNWSSCTGGKQYIKAQQQNELNKTLDFYLPANSGLYPIGDIAGPLTCQQAVYLLGKSDMVTGKKMASDPAYNLAAQFIAAKLNVLAGAATCPAATTAIAAAQTLLDAVNFTGTGSYKNSMTASQITQANSLASTLDSYNNNTLCP